MAKNSTQTNYEVTRLFLFTKGDIIDINAKFTKFEIYEDIHSPFLIGAIDIFDADTMIETGSILGEDEYIEFEFTITGSNNLANRKMSGKLYIYKIEDERQENNRSDIFRLRLVSESFFLNTKARNRKFYEATQSDIVSEIAEEQLGREMVRIDKTELEQRYIFPNWHPIACITSMSYNSRSVAYKGEPDYVFYEDLEGFHYVSMSYMIDEKNGKVLPFVGDDWFRNLIVTESTNPKFDNNLVAQYKKSAFDIVDNVNKGLYGATMINHNIARRKWRQDVSGYAETFKEFEHLAPHELSERGEDYGKSRYQLIPSNTFGSGVYPEDIYPLDKRKTAIREMQSEQNIFALVIDGDPGKPGAEMKIGRPLKFNVRSKKGGPDDETDNIYLSGKFLVTRIRHVFQTEAYTQYVQVIKDSYEDWV